MNTKHESHLGVYAIILSDDRQKILLVKKALGCYTGLYDLPGGGMDEGELPEDTLKREILEETGCRVTSYKQAGTVAFLHPFIKSDEHITLRHLGIIYLSHAVGEPLSTPAGGDSAGCEWLSLDALSPSNSSPLVIEARKLL